MTLLADLEEFVTEHQPHGTLTGDAGEVTPSGYRLAGQRTGGLRS